MCNPLQRIELEAVKRERSHLMASLAEIKTQSGKAGGELQQEDVRRLRKEVELKMEKLNEIRKVRTDLYLECASCAGEHHQSHVKPSWTSGSLHTCICERDRWLCQIVMLPPVHHVMLPHTCLVLLQRWLLAATAGTYSISSHAGSAAT